MKPFSFAIFVAFITLISTANTFAKTWQVGTGRTYILPSQVADLVSNGDTVDIDAGTYTDCATWNASDLLLRGVGNGYAHLLNQTCSDKGIWVLFGNNITIENMELSGAVSSSYNGAGVRAQGGSFTIRHCYIHNNQMGVLASMTDSANVLIEYSIFADNVSPNEAVFAHNIYINTCDTFILRYCYVHGAEVGHNVKSRARVNCILYNRIMDQEDSASRDIDLPNGGQAVVMGNVIEKGPNAPNTNTMAFGLEGMINPGPQNLYVVSNTFVNDLPARGIYITVPNSGFDTLQVTNNIFAGTGVLLNGSPAVLDTATNLFTASIPSVGLVNAPMYDYHLTANSPAIGEGSSAGFADGFLLMPLYEYVDTAMMQPRPATKGRNIDLGAYEWTSPEGVAEQQTVSPSGIVIEQDPLFMQATVILPDRLNDRTHIIVFDILGRAIASIASPGSDFGRNTP